MILVNMLNKLLQEIKIKKIVKKFKKRNRLNKKDFKNEDYLKGLNDRVYQFLNQDIFLVKSSNNNQIKAFLQDKLKNEYIYYSEKVIKRIFSDYYSRYFSKSIGTEFILAPIKDTKNPNKNKSSDSYIHDFAKSNNIYDGKIYDVIYNTNSLDTSKSIEVILKKKRVDTILLIDDYSGTGTTVINYLKELEKFVSDKEIEIFIIHLTELAQAKINDFIDDDRKNRFRLNKFKVSKMNHTDAHDKIISEFESDVIKTMHPLGFEKSKELVTFYRNTPNNTYSSFWDTYIDVWNPLFPRKEIITQNQYNTSKSIISYNLKRFIGSESLDSVLEVVSYKTLITIISINLKKNITNFDLCHILAYNETQLKVHKRDMEEDGWLKKSQLRLTPQAQKIIVNYELTNVSSFTELTTNSISDNFVNSDDKLSFEDVYVPKASIRFYVHKKFFTGGLG